MIIGIMGAMPDEVDQLCAKLENVTVAPYGGVEYHKGTLAGKEVVVCCAARCWWSAAAIRMRPPTHRSVWRRSTTAS